MASTREVRRRDVWGAAAVIIAALAFCTGWMWRSAVNSILLEARQYWTRDIDTATKPLADRLDRVDAKLERVAEKVR